ncbi:MAG: hypothetical protein BroJett030_06800 [Alphaproteobacteria bacterium]|nr:MAG: hypothetical protein BroJett030_06800 [Alphaproteobacteria bacterium]
MTEKTLTAHVTYLEMRARPFIHVPRPLAPGLALMRAEAMPVAFYRYLYDEVGRPYHWYLRRRLDDATLAAIIHAPTTQIDVLYVGGCPAGYFELDSSGLPDKVALAYFGLCRDYLGRGLGKWLLSAAIAAAWEHGPQRVTVNTNTLDHPAALPLYQKLGFEPVGTATERIPVVE